MRSEGTQVSTLISLSNVQKEKEQATGERQKGSRESGVCGESTKTNFDKRNLPLSCTLLRRWGLFWESLMIAMPVMAGYMGDM